MSWFGLGDSRVDGEPLELDDCETPETEEDYLRISEESLDECLELFNSPDWKIIPFNNPNVSLSELTIPNFPLKCIKTSAVVNGTPEQVKAFMGTDDYSERIKWDTELIELRIVEKIKGIEVVFQSYKAPFGIASRSFCATRATRVLPDGTLLSGGKSINHKKCPYQSKYVRGVATSGLFYKPVKGDPNKCEVTRLVKLDPKGSIPKAAVNLGISKTGHATAHLIEIIREESKHWKKVDKVKPVVAPAPIPDVIPSKEADRSLPSNNKQKKEKKKEKKDKKENFTISENNNFQDFDDIQFFETSSILNDHSMSFQAIENIVKPLTEGFKAVESCTTQNSELIKTTLSDIQKQQTQLNNKLNKLERELKMKKQLANSSAISAPVVTLLVAWPVVVIGLYELYKKVTK